jgi:hypothetical protein
MLPIILRTQIPGQAVRDQSRIVNKGGKSARKISIGSPARILLNSPRKRKMGSQCFCHTDNRFCNRYDRKTEYEIQKFPRL